MLSVLRLTNRCVKNSFNLKLKNGQIIRSFGKNNLDNLKKAQIFENTKSLIKPLVFTVGLSATVYSVYVVYNFETSVRLKQKFNNWNQWKQNLSSFPYSERNRSDRTPSSIKQLTDWWNTRNESFKLFVGIAAINVLVFLCWKVPRLKPFMAKHFMTDTTNKPLKCWPMLWSTFSHYSATHLVFNLVVLHSFSQIGGQLFGWDQLLALYLTSGVVSSFGSYLARAITGRVGSSLGASGAILGVLSSCCILRPDLQLVIIFLPFFTISAGIALKSIILMDSLGLILGWRFFDHGAHLAGTLFGIWYTTYGQNIILTNRSQVINIWQKIRNKII